VIKLTISERNASLWPDISISETLREEIREWAKTVKIESETYIEHRDFSSGPIFDIREDCGSMFASRSAYTPLLEKPE